MDVPGKMDDSLSRLTSYLSRSFAGGNGTGTVICQTMRGLLDAKVTHLFSLLLLGILALLCGCDGRQIRPQRRSRPRMLGIDTGNAEADREAEMWLMALIGVLVAAVPIALLSPSLGFRKDHINSS